MTAFVMPMPVSVKAVAFGEAQFHMNRHHLPSQTSSYRSAILPKILVLDLHFAGGWISTETWGRSNSWKIHFSEVKLRLLVLQIMCKCNQEMCRSIHEWQKSRVPSRSAVQGRANLGLPEDSPISEQPPTAESSSANVTLLIWRQSPTLSLQTGGGTLQNY